MRRRPHPRPRESGPAVHRGACAGPSAPAPAGVPRASRCSARSPSPRPPTMVVSVSPIATAVGVETLRRGGARVDTASPSEFALAVVHPAAGNIGGGGFMVFRFASGETAAIDYRETAPGRATPDMFLDSSGKVTEAPSPDTQRGVRQRRGRGGAPAHGRLPPTWWRPIRLAREGSCWTVTARRDRGAADRQHGSRPPPRSSCGRSHRGAATCWWGRSRAHAQAIADSGPRLLKERSPTYQPRWRGAAISRAGLAYRPVWRSRSPDSAATRSTPCRRPARAASRWP
jgi:hypothetical protein